MTAGSRDPRRPDVAVVGAGGAGLAIVLALDRLCAATGVDPPAVTVVDPVHRAADDRTWCWWAHGPHPLDPLLTAAWRRVELVGADGTARTHELGDLRYVMLRSSDYYAEADRALERIGGARLTATVRDVDPGGVVRLTGDQPEVRAGWVFDSRPVRPVRPGRTTLLQHFRGRLVRLPGARLEPGVATLMDFSVPQPPVGVAFVYVLPLAPDRALVEYTEFSPAVLTSPEYDAALDTYLRRRWPLVVPEVEHVEDGVIRMTDAPFASRAGRRVFRIGTAGGATRPSTGYTFTTMQRQAEGIAAALLRGAEPVPPRPVARRHRWMDAVLLRAVRDGLVDPPSFFTGLFDRNPPGRVVRFLDGVSSPLEELAVMRSSPLAPMTRASLADALTRLRDHANSPPRSPS